MVACKWKSDVMGFMAPLNSAGREPASEKHDDDDDDDYDDE